MLSNFFKILPCNIYELVIAEFQYRFIFVHINGYDLLNAHFVLQNKL